VANSTIPTMSFTRRALLRYGGLALVIGVPVLILVLFILYPLLAIILQSVFPNIYGHLVI
jgi:iron(III) transport system permease protein